MHHNESIINEQQPSTAPVTVDNSNINNQHYQHSHQSSQPQHVGLMSNPQSNKLDSIDYNIHRVNDSSLYNQMVFCGDFFINSSLLIWYNLFAAIFCIF